MKIAIIGYGKMGRMIEKTALSRGHTITARVDLGSEDTFDSPGFKEADVAIEFSVPQAAAGNIRASLERHVPVVSGTTGWTSRLPEMRELALAEDSALFWASNFSIGMNLFMALNRYMATLMAHVAGYSPSLEEIHHIHKLDHPSGTAVTLAEDLASCFPAITGWEEREDGKAAQGILPVKCVREGEVPGIHEIDWTSDADRISLRHEAFSREGFALGAVLAAEWVPGRKGFFGMTDFLADTVGNIIKV